MIEQYDWHVIAWFWHRMTEKTLRKIEFNVPIEHWYEDGELCFRKVSPQELYH